MESLNVRPLVKWVGGKRELPPSPAALLSGAFNRYVEPFLGSGAVFFDLYRAGRLRDRDVVLIDSNPDLIGCYESVRDNPDAIVRRVVNSNPARRGFVDEFLITNVEPLAQSS